MQQLRDWEGEWGECIRQRGVGRALVQKVLKTASKYAENGDLFTQIQVNLINSAALQIKRYRIKQLRSQETYYFFFL